MKNCVIQVILIGLLMVNFSKGQSFQLSCTACACADICTEAVNNFGCTTCNSESCTVTGTTLAFTFTCDSDRFVGTYDNSNQNLEYHSIDMQ